MTRKAIKVILIILVTSIAWVAVVREQEEEKARSLYDRGKEIYEKARKQDSVPSIARDDLEAEKKSVHKNNVYVQGKKTDGMD